VIHESPVVRFDPHLRPSVSATSSRRAELRPHDAPFVDRRHRAGASRLAGAAGDFTREAVPSFRYRSILVPVDGTSFAEHALPWALGIARRAGAEVRVVLVHRPTLSADNPWSIHHAGCRDARRRHGQLAHLDDLSRRLAESTSVPVHVELAQGRDVAGLLCAAGADADLVVMATHGRGLLGRFWYGSVADAVVGRADAPVLLVRGYDAPVDLTGDPRVRHVVIPLDGSKFAERILEPALALGHLTGADHTLFRVSQFEAEEFAHRGDGRPRPGFDEGWHAEERSYIREAADRVSRPGRQVRSRLVLDEQATPRAILRFARAHDADLVALATRGRRGLVRLFGAGVADGVIRRATMPVLVFRPSS
jgi:nucleotide-binding universal stress UspA family protein